MLKLSDLLTKGYFPKELPPPFHTAEFARLVKSYGRAVPKPLASDKFISQCAIHNLPRSGSLRRELGLPNPVSFYRLARFIRRNWITLSKHTKKSRLSLTVPRVGGDRAIDRTHSLKELPRHRASLRSKSRYILRADVSRFYESIYTHSIPWALHGKMKSKADKTSSDLIGNSLDKLVREGQDLQSMGVPIGPDTSFLIAEVILTAVDEALVKRRLTGGFRYVDDYEFGFQTLSEAQEALCILQEVLSEYELALNPDKTEIITLPWPTEELAISELRTFRFRPSSGGQYFDLLHYFDKAFTFARQNPRGSVLSFAVARLTGITVRKQNWAFCEDLLLQCANAEPGTIRYVFEQILKYRNLGYRLHAGHIQRVLNTIIEQHAPQGHGGDVAWALWGLLVLRKKLSKKAASSAARMKDPIVAVLLCDADDKELVPDSTDWEYLASLMTPEDLHGPMWLFSYEANRRGWLRSARTKDHVLAVPAFALLKKADVSFYDEGLSDTIEPEEPEGWKLVLAAGPAYD